MSQKYYDSGNLESIREDFKLYYREWQKNRHSGHSKASEIRCRFSFLMYCRLMYEKTNDLIYKKREECAKRKYDSLFTGEIYSPNHKRS